MQTEKGPAVGKRPYPLHLHYLYSMSFTGMDGNL